MDILTHGQQEGEVGQDVDLDLLAWYYFGILQAVVNLPSVGANSQTLDGLIDVAMLAWPENKV